MPFPDRELPQTENGVSIPETVLRTHNLELARVKRLEKHILKLESLMLMENQFEILTLRITAAPLSIHVLINMNTCQTKQVGPREEAILNQFPNGIIKNESK